MFDIDFGKSGQGGGGWVYLSPTFLCFENPIREELLSVRLPKIRLHCRLVDHKSPDFYPGICVALVTLLTYPVSTCAAERCFSGMKRLKPLFLVP